MVYLQQGSFPGAGHGKNRGGDGWAESAASGCAEGVLNAFAGAILRGEPLVADGREGIRGLLLSNAMQLSAWLGREVTLPFDEQLFHDLLMEKCKTSRHKEERDVIASTEGSY